MKKALILLLAMGFSTAAQADHHDPSSNEKIVKCYLRYSIDDNSGSVLTSRMNEPKEVKLDQTYHRAFDGMSGISMVVSLKQKCVDKNAKCEGKQDLSVSVKRGDVSTSAVFTTPFTNKKLILEVGDVVSIATCGQVYR